MKNSGKSARIENHWRIPFGPARKKGAKGERRGTQVKRIVSGYLKPYYLRMTVGFIIKFSGTCMDLCLPWILAQMIDVVIPTGQKDMIFKWGVLMLACAAGAAVFNITANRMASRVAAVVTENLRQDLFEKIMHLSSKQTGEVGKPSLISRLTSDTYNVYNVVGRVQRLGVRAPLLLMGGIAITMTLDVQLACILLAALVILGFVVFFVSRHSVPMYTSLQRAADRLVLAVRENIAGIRVIKALSKESWEKERFAQVNDQVVRCERTAGITMAVINPVMNLVLNLGLVAIVAAGAMRVNAGRTEIGVILAFLTYFTIILNALLSISKMITVLSKGIASADRIQSVLEFKEELREERDYKAESVAYESGCACAGNTASYHIEFHKVDFGYFEGKRNLEQISFGLRRGGTLGIIGATGSGKSTLLRLLLRFYDVTAGEILIDGRDIRGMKLGELRSRFGVVFQNDVIFNNSILENVRLGREISERQIERALECAQAGAFVNEKSGRLGERLNIRGANLSGGQKQRVLIARALAGGPEFLVLDDSSSALDYQTDAGLRRALDREYAHTTKLIVTQRVSSILHADQILVLDNGRMAGLGTHGELLLHCPQYREISRSQMGVS